MRAAIGMTGGAFEGEAQVSPDANDRRFIDANLSGSIEGHTITFLVWISADQQPEPFTCTATLNGRANLIRGTWRHPCYGGDGCRCEGGGGIFELRRVRN
jgi:hypothetical protein